MFYIFTLAPSLCLKLCTFTLDFGCSKASTTVPLWCIHKGQKLSFNSSVVTILATQWQNKTLVASWKKHIYFRQGICVLIWLSFYIFFQMYVLCIRIWYYIQRFKNQMSPKNSRQHNNCSQTLHHFRKMYNSQCWI